MIAVMQAYADGKKIEWQGYGVWQEAVDPWWDWVHMDYRIKPEPKTCLMTNRELARWCAEGKCDDYGQVSECELYIKDEGFEKNDRD